MQTRFLIATVLVVLFALTSAKWSWVEDSASSLGAAQDEIAKTLGAAQDEIKTLAYSDAEVLQQQGSLSANHQEAKDADALLNALIKRLTQQIADDSAATNQKVSDRTNSIKKFDDAVNAAKAYLDDLTNQQTALNKKIDEAKTALATRQGEKTAEQAAIDKENAEQRARLAERIAAVEKQIALIKQILVLLSGEPINPKVPDSIILDSAGEQAIAGLFTGTPFANKQFVRCYRASENKYDANVYLANCKGKPNLVTIIKSANGNVFGGFAVPALDLRDAWIADTNAFLFSYIRGAETKLVKLPVINNGQTATASANNYGPFWGHGHDLMIRQNCNTGAVSYSNPGNGFTAPPGTSANTAQAQSYFAGSKDFVCADYEVFQLV